MHNPRFFFSLGFFFLFFLLFPCLFTCLITAGFVEGQDVTSQMLSQIPVSLLNHELLLLDVILSSVHSLLSCIQSDPFCLLGRCFNGALGIPQVVRSLSVLFLAYKSRITLLIL